MAALALLLLLPLPALASDCGQPAEPISLIQGSGARSPQTGNQVTVEGVVTFDASQEGGLRGFFLQQVDPDSDSNPATSEALFVFSDRHALQPGQRVRVSGTVREYHGLTELAAVTALESCGKGSLPAPVPITLPWPERQTAEYLEGMRVSLASPLVVIDHFNLHRYGTLTLAPRQQPVPTQILPPGPEAQALQRNQQQQRLILDDGLSQQFPDPVPHVPGGLSLSRTLRAGTEVGELTGVLDYRYGEWRLHPDSAPQFHASNPRPPAPARLEGNTVRLLTLNLGNYFNGEAGGFSDSRGARNPEELRRQTRRLVATLKEADPDIAAVTELENDGYGPESAIASLALALGPDWRYIRRRSNDGNDAIRVALLYRESRVEPVGTAVSPPPGSPLYQGRPPLLQRFRPTTGGATVAIAVAHLKSKSCRNARRVQRDQHDGQGCYAARRLASTEALIQWLAELPHQPDSAGILITGDLNSYAKEQPLQRLATAGYTDLVQDFGENTASSYRFRGRSGTLDYSLADVRLRPRIRQAHIWGINADEPRALGYAFPASEQAGSNAVPWRGSDHDPVITDLDLQSP